jgi:hypothetical protein
VYLEGTLYPWISILEKRKGLGSLRCAHAHHHVNISSMFITLIPKKPKESTITPLVPFVGLASQGKDIVFRFIIEYSCLKDFDP